MTSIPERLISASVASPLAFDHLNCLNEVKLSQNGKCLHQKKNLSSATLTDSMLNLVRLENTRLNRKATARPKICPRAMKKMRQHLPNREPTQNGQPSMKGKEKPTKK